jgi:cytochrome c peroxidase
MRILSIALVMAGTLAAGEGAYDWSLPRGFPRPHVPAGNPVSEVKARLGRYLF